MVKRTLRTDARSPAITDWRRQLLDCANQETAKKVERAIDAMLRNDAHLFAVDANERSIAHRLATFLAVEFEEYDIDCEYNRDEGDPKRVPKARPVESEEEDLVLPDIIVHKRGGDGPNLLVIEIKKSARGLYKDRGKIRRIKGKYGYEAALLIAFEGEDPKITLEWV